MGELSPPDSYNMITSAASTTAVHVSCSPTNQTVCLNIATSKLLAIASILPIGSLRKLALSAFSSLRTTLSSLRKLSISALVASCSPALEKDSTIASACSFASPVASMRRIALAVSIRKLTAMQSSNRVRNFAHDQPINSCSPVEQRSYEYQRAFAVEIVD